MKKRLISISLVIIFIFSMSCTALAANINFTDVSSSNWYYQPIKWAVENNVTSGMGDGTFGVGQYCTREQIVTFLYSSEGKPSANYNSNKFSDVKSNDWYSNAVNWAVNYGITSGMGDGTFGVGQNCTREQAVQFIYSLAGKPSIASQQKFKDVPNGKWYSNAVNWAVNAGITSGTGNGYFGTGNICTREEIVTFIWRYKTLVNNQSASSNSSEIPAFAFKDDSETLQQMMDRINAITPEYREGYLTNGKPATEENIKAELAKIQITMSQGTQWDSDERYKYTTFDAINLECASYARAISDYLFGEDAPLYVYDNLIMDKVNVGDIVYIYKGNSFVYSIMHWVIVTDKTDTGFSSTSGNYNKSVYWTDGDYSYSTFKELGYGQSYFISRNPVPNVNYNYVKYDNAA